LQHDYINDDTNAIMYHYNIIVTHKGLGPAVGVIPRRSPTVSE